MKNPLCIILGLWLIIFCTKGAQAQYVLNGNAVKESCNCYQLTPERQNQSGSVWQETKINLNEPFDFIFEVYLGCRDSLGADGIVFIVQPDNKSIGTAGEGLGFQGIKPSLGIALDTYQNFDEVAFDHISIQTNGKHDHENDIAGPIAASATSKNIEDCKWHTFRIKWEPATHTISTYFDGVSRLSAQLDLVATIFNNDPMVYWGFSAATGGSFNVQKFCTALVPQSVTDLANDAACLGTPVIFQDNSSSFSTIKNYHWDFGDGTTSTEKDPPPHVYAAPGIYQVKHSITGMDGCESAPFTKTVTIGDKPQIAMNISDTCEGFSPRMDISANLKVGTITEWKWELDGIMLGNTAAIDLSHINAGTHNIQLSVTSSAGCASDVVTDQFTIKNSPYIDFTFEDGCINESILFTGLQTDAATAITSWQWDFGNNSFSGEKEAAISYDVSKNYPVKLLATAGNGCFALVEKNILINEAKADAGKDTVVLPDTFFQLNGGGGDLYSWMPSTGLSNPQIANPTGSISEDITYHLRVETMEGCVDTASVNILVFKGSAVYVPNAFTPNYDGLNDVLQPYLIGIKTLNFFTIFDRWGNKVFSTNDPNDGWDGNWKGRNLEAGTYVWVLKAEDLIGKMYDLRGSFILIK